MKKGRGRPRALLALSRSSSPCRSSSRATSSSRTRASSSSRSWRRAGTSSAATRATPRSATSRTSGSARTRRASSCSASGTCRSSRRSRPARSSPRCVAILLGLPILRLKGHYFAIATLGVAEALAQVADTWDSVTEGSTGIDLPIKSEGEFFYYTALGVRDPRPPLHVGVRAVEARLRLRRDPRGPGRGADARRSTRRSSRSSRTRSRPSSRRSRAASRPTRTST